MISKDSMWGRAAGTAALLILFLLGGNASVGAQQTDAPPAPQAGVRVDTVLVRGNVRVSEAVVRGTSGLRSGSFVRSPEIQSAIRRIMATGEFESVEIAAVGEPPSVALAIQVVERPWLAAVEFTGMESVSAKTVRDTVGLTPNVPLNPAQVLRTETMIRDLLSKRGIQVLAIDTSLVPVEGPPGSVRLRFDVVEGQRIALADIAFEGNQAFTDEQLRAQMQTREEGFLWFRTGKFDRETFRDDLRESLPTFYGSRGFIDFAVLSDSLVVDPQSGKARLIVTVAEGPQYRLGEFAVEGNSRFPSEQLERYFRAERSSVLGLPFGSGGEREQGEVFNREALESATQQVSKLYSNEGYLYARVEPVLRRNPAPEPGASPTVDVTWAVREGSPFYIRRVAIEGNTRTHDAVIRERLMVVPGDVYNEDRLIASWTGIGALGYFETPMPTPDIDPDPETGLVDITFRVTEKQTGNINFGTSIGGGYAGQGGGISGFLGFTEPNLFGQGKEASFRAEWGPWRRDIQGSYTDPSLFGTRNSATASVFHAGDRFPVSNNVRRKRTGGSLQFGTPVPGFVRTRAFFGYSLSQTAYEGVDEADCLADPNQIACFPDATASSLTLAVTRDTKSHPLFPVSGTRQSLSLEQTGGPLGGDGSFQKAIGSMEWWVPAGRIGGSAPGQRPIRLALGLRTRAGMIFGDASPFPFERFFAGGTQMGEAIRGYRDASITAGGFDESCRGNFRPDCLGNSFTTITAEYSARVNDQLSIGVFGDAGGVWRDPGEFNPSRLFRGAGVGGMVMTPFGPIGLDLAYGFDRVDAAGRPNPGWEVHFKFGQGF